MATSGTTTFESSFSIDEVIEEAYERIGQQPMSGQEMKSARRSLNIMFQEWANRGLEMSYRNSSSVDFPLTKINRSQYQSLSNKTDTGTPTQYFVQRFIDRVTVTLYLTPGSTEAGNFINYYYVSRIQDAGAYTNESDVPYRFVPCMVSGLAFYLSQKFAPQRTQEMKLLYEDELQRALQEDGSSSSAYISPKVYYPSV